MEVVMWRIFCLVVVLLLFAAPLSYADTPVSKYSVTGSADQNELCSDVLSTDELAKRGCCSWHGGVCGCKGGRAVCCDGSYSPSCGCEAGTEEIQDKS